MLVLQDTGDAAGLNTADASGAATLKEPSGAGTSGAGAEASTAQVSGCDSSQIRDAGGV